MFNGISKAFRMVRKTFTNKKVLEERKDLCRVIRLLLRALEDGQVTPTEAVSLRTMAYDILLKYDMDKN